MKVSLLNLLKMVSKNFMLGMVLQCILFTGVFAEKANAQRNIKEVYINFSETDLPLISLLTNIEEKTEFSFVYPENYFNKNQIISIGKGRRSVSDVLFNVASQTNLKFKQINEAIYIGKGRQIKKNVEVMPVHAVQDFTIRGTVTSSEHGEPMPGVNVLLKGGSTGTVTDVDGNYSIDVPDENGILVFSFVGFATQEVPIDGRPIINLAMEPHISELQEVVVIGYGTVRKSDLTGAVSTIKNEDMNPGVVVSADQALKGRVSGVQIAQTSGEPGGGVSVRIRGANSITGGNEPLYVIDGLPINNIDMLTSGGAAFVSGNPNARNPLNSLNPNDIESIEVLKDASAAAIYGSRGANGVIMITTKKGKKGGLRVNLENYVGVQSVYKKLDVLSTGEYIETMNTLAEERGNQPVFDADEVEAIGAGTDWQDEIFRNARVNNHNLSVSGGNESSSYFTSFNYFNQEGVVIGSGIERYTARFNTEQKLSNRLTFGINSNFSLVNDNNNVDGTGINETAGPINAAFQYDPTLSPKQPDGSFTVSPDLTLNNPLAIVDAIQSVSETNRVFGTTFLDYKIIDDLSARFKIGIDRQIGRRDIYNARGTFWGGAGGGQADVRMLQRNSKLLEYIMTYDNTWDNDISFNAVVGTTYEDFTNSTFSSSVSDFPTDILGTNNLGLGNTENATVGSYKATNSLHSYLGRINLSLFNEFLITTSFRADGSSRFGENNKWSYFPSAAVAWKMANKDFVPEIFSELKLRNSWGRTGNQEIGNYASISTLGLGDLAFLGGQAQRGTVPVRIANPDLKWEETTSWDIGLDVGIWEDRLVGSFDYFIKNTNDMLINFPIPPSTGFGSVLSNIGSMRNSGFEAMVESRNIVGADFTWNTSVVFSSVENEVTDIGDLEQINTGNIFTSNIGIIKPGLPLNAYYTYKVIGIFQDEDQVKNSAQPSSAPGNPIYLDANKDGTINADDRVVVGSPWPDFTFGIRNSFSYKNFGLDIFIDGQQGADLLNGNAVESLHPVNERRNRIREQITDRWTPENPDAKWPSGINPSTYGADKVNSLVIEDASYMRLQSVQLSYNWSSRKINFIDKARIYVTLQNFLILTDYSGVNPEANAYGKSNIRADYSSYPLSKTILFGLNLNF